MKLGIMSASRIVEEFLTQVWDIPGLQITAFCVREQSLEKARSMLAANHLRGVRVYTDYAQFLAEGDFDFLYNGTANHLHYSQTKQALLAGRNVILEKPFTTTLAETEELFRLAEEKRCYLFEAITTPYLPDFAFLRQMLPDIAPVRGAMASFSKYSSRYDQYLAHQWTTTFDPACAGGALMDMNVYNLHLVAGLLGSPEHAQYFPNKGYNGIDTSGLAVLAYPDFSAACLAGKDSESSCGATIAGQHGYLEIEGMPNALGRVRAVVDGQVVEGPAQTHHRMVYEFVAFEKIWRERDQAAYAAATARTLAVMALLDSLHKAVD